MRHCAEASSTFFVKKNISELPTTMEELQQHLQNLPDSILGERLMRFSKWY